MSLVAGIDLSSFAIDIVLLDEDTDAARWHRVELTGPRAWHRTLSVRESMPASSFWDDVYLVAVEVPTPDQRRELRLVQGSVIACLPAKLRQDHTIMEVHQQTWKSRLGLKAKPTVEDIAMLGGSPLALFDEHQWADQNARDAYCIALHARNINRAALATSL